MLHPILYEDLLRRALLEDLGGAGDLTTDSVIPAKAVATGYVVARRALRVAGLEPALFTFRLLDPAIQIEAKRVDGEDAADGEVLARLRGSARALLTAERTALNLLGRLCGIATTTRNVVAKVAHSRARIVCTRKTTPGLRALEKYAVRMGGGSNHRFGLDDGVLIKDNHRLVAGSVRTAIERARRGVGHLTRIEVEVDTLDELREALAAGADAVLLDNMSPDALREAVALVAGRATTEASGGITPGNVAAVAATGVDLISLGWLTHSAPSADVALDLEVPA